MSYLYLTNRYPVGGMPGSRTLPEIADLPIKSILPAASGSDSVFRTMKRVYQFLDSWKAAHPDTPLLLSVDQKTAKIVNSYFYEMSESDYEHFSIKEGEVLQYLL